MDGVEDVDEDPVIVSILDCDDFGGIDNEGLDFNFSEFEDFINDASKNSSYFQEALINSDLKICEGLPKIKSVTSSRSNTPHNSRDSQTPSTAELAHISLAKLPNTTYESFTHSSSHPSSSIATENINRIKLPESPPDSSSEPPLSPINPDHLLNGNEETNKFGRMMQSSGETMKHFMVYNNTQPLKHLPETSLNQPIQLSPQQPSVQVSIPPHSTVSQTLSAVPSQNASIGSVLNHLQQQIPSSLTSGLVLQQQQTLGPPTTHLTSLYDSNEDFLCESLDNTNNSHKKKKLSDSHKNVVNNNLLNGIISVKQKTGGISPEPHSNAPVISTTDDEYSLDLSGPDGSGLFLDSAYQCIRFQPFQQNTWAILCDHTLKELPPPNFRVDADKGFNFSNADDAFVCQKKNHFQVTVHVQPIGEPHYVRTPEGVKKIDNFFLQFNGVKVESPSQTIKVEQSQSDRTKKPFHPVPLELNPEEVTKTTVGRLHFSETTSNNMRKKGKPNPDQRYFYLVVSLCVSSGDLSYIVIAHASERIIVRASNPGQFENDMELSWQRGQLADSIYHAGRVGINTDRPDEALVIHGNMKVTGHIVQPSDVRAKTNIEEVDTKEQLKNVANMRIVRYQYSPEFAKHIGLSGETATDTGVIAQEVQTLIPEAVQGAGDIVLPSGQHIDNFLVVNKERIFMENVGAVKELCKVTDNLETRIDELEKVNKKLNKVKKFDSVKSNSSCETVTSHASSFASNKVSRHAYSYKQKSGTKKSFHDDYQYCSNHFLQAIIIILIFIMAFCLIAMASLYVLEWRKRHIPILALNIDEKSPSFNITSTDKTLFNSYFEADKSQSNYANSIAMQDVKKDTRLNQTRTLRLFSTLSLSQEAETLSYSTTTSPWLSLYQAPTSVPILKPRLIGSPNHCKSVYYHFPDCPIYCCSLTASQRRAMSENNEDGPNYAELRIRSSEHSTRFINDDDIFQINRTHLNKTIAKEKYDNESTAFSIPTTTSASLTSAETALDIIGDHPVYQNQLKPSRDIGISQRRKLLNEKNITDETSESTLNHFSQKLKNNAKNEKMPPLLNGTPQKRMRRGDESRGLLAKSYARKDLPKSIESLKLVELNATIGQEYCNTLQCVHGTGPRFSYLIPLSKYMIEEYVTLQFNLAIPLVVDHCQPDAKPVACPVPQNGAGDLPHAYIREQNLTEEVDPSWRLPIGLYLRSMYRFRIQARSVVTDTPCSLPNDELGHTFIEFILVFQRKCDK